MDPTVIENLRLPPVLSVILPVFNAKQFVEHAVVSILQQSYSNFELIIIDDGSFDGTTDILKRLSSQNARIVLFVRENRGLVASLNEGIRMAQGEFIARMDADDFALPQRFADQIAYLHRTGYDLCGTAVQCFGKSELVWRYPSTPAEVEVQLLFDSPYAHPSTMCKASLYKTLGYRNVFAGAEDYDLWQRAWQLGAKGANLPEVLLRYRVHDAQISNAQKVHQRLLADEVRQRHWHSIAGRTYDTEIKQLLVMFKGESGELASVGPLLNQVMHKYHGSAQVLFVKNAFRICTKAAASSQRPWKVWRDLLVGSEVGRNMKQELILFAIWLLGLGPQSRLYHIAKFWHLRRK